MPLQDLTPQLRTRLSRLEKLVGWFVTLAILLLFCGLGFYVYKLASNRGWFLAKMPYFTFLKTGAGLKEGDRVKLLGNNVGQILKIDPMPPESEYNICVQFEINWPYHGYLWDDSRVVVGDAGFLGTRYLEVTKGTNGIPTYAMNDILELSLPEVQTLTASATNIFVFAQDIFFPGTTNFEVRFKEAVTAQKLAELGRRSITKVEVMNPNSPPPNPPRWMWNEKAGAYQPIPKHSKGYWIIADESPALTERLQTVASTIEAALPGFLELTNKIASVLSNANNITTHADELLVSAKPIVTNAAAITANLKNPKGSLGEWLLPTNINLELEKTLGSAQTTMAAAQTNLNAISTNILPSLINVANLTSNLNVQVQSSPIILPEISDLISHTDDMVQGLKRLWLLRSAFEQITNAPPESVIKPRLGQ
jgi:hypothetical protein